jgi:negative regulator of flagellin synthesis FlgM
VRIDTPPYVVDLQRTREVRETTATATKAAATPAAGKVAAKSVDVVVLSSQSRELARLNQQLSSLPDVRLDRVALAKQQMQQGGYRVDPKELAQKMLEGMGKG